MRRGHQPGAPMFVNVIVPPRVGVLGSGTWGPSPPPAPVALLDGPPPAPVALLDRPPPAPVALLDGPPPAPVALVDGPPLARPPPPPSPPRSPPSPQAHARRTRATCTKNDERFISVSVSGARWFRDEKRRGQRW